MEQLTKNATKIRSVVQPFRNHKVDFTTPQITEKVPLFGTDKWVERQSRSIAKQFTEIIRKIESIYMKDAARQVEAVQRNILADYEELYQLRKDVITHIENNDDLKSTLEQCLINLQTLLSAQRYSLLPMLLLEEHLLQSPLVAEMAATLIPIFVGTAAGRTRRKRRIGGGA